MQICKYCIVLDRMFGKYQCNNRGYNGVLIIEENSSSNKHEEIMKKDLEQLKMQMKEKND